MSGMSSPSCQMQVEPLASTPCSCQVPFGRQHEIVGAERHALAVDDRVGAFALHDEAQRARHVLVGRGGLAGLHDLDAGIEQPDGGRDLAPARDSPA
jgi:hypothetical protein